MLRHGETRYKHPILEGRDPEGQRLGSISLQTSCIDRHYVCYGQRGRRWTGRTERTGRIYSGARRTVKGDLRLLTQL